MNINDHVLFVCVFPVGESSLWHTDSLLARHCREEWPAPGEEFDDVVASTNQHHRRGQQQQQQHAERILAELLRVAQVALSIVYQEQEYICQVCQVLF